MSQPHRRAVIEEHSYRKQSTKTKQKRKPGVKALEEIRRYQHSTSLLIQRAPFTRVIKEILASMSIGEELRMQSEAICALHEVCSFLFLAFNAEYLILGV